MRLSFQENKSVYLLDIRDEMLTISVKDQGLGIPN